MHLSRALLPDQVAGNAERVLVDRNHLLRLQDAQRTVVQLSAFIRITHLSSDITVAESKADLLLCATPTAQASLAPRQNHGRRAPY